MAGMLGRSHSAATVLLRPCRVAPKISHSVKSHAFFQTPTAANRPDSQSLHWASASVRNSSLPAQGPVMLTTARDRFSHSGLKGPARFAAFSTDAGEGKEPEAAPEKTVEEPVEESIEKDLSSQGLENEQQLEAAMGEQKESGKKKIKRISREEMNKWRIPLPDHKLLSPEVREMMLQLHKEDPVKYDFKALGEKYGVSWIRAKAIVLLEQEHEKREQSDVSEGEREMLGLAADLDKAWYDRFGTVAHGTYTKTYHAELEGYRGAEADAQERNISARPRPLYTVVEPSKAIKIVKRLETRYDPSLYANPTEKELARLKAAAAAAVPVQELEQKSGFQPTASKRFKYVFADISKGVRGEERWVAVRQPDGSLRAASYDERFRVEKFVRPPILPRK